MSKLTRRFDRLEQALQPKSGFRLLHMPADLADDPVAVMVEARLQRVERRPNDLLLIIKRFGASSP